MKEDTRKKTVIIGETNRRHGVRGNGKVIMQKLENKDSMINDQEAK